MQTNTKKKSVRRFIRRKYFGANKRLVHFFDGRKDKKICGCSLVKYVPSLCRETMGATGSEATCYWALDKIFEGERFDENDSFIDVGCGKGRVLAYLVSRNYPCSLTGIELNKDVAEYAQSWAIRYKSINIIHGNAFDLDFNDYTVLFLGRPFETETFHVFIDQLEDKLIHPVKLFYWWDTQSGAYLENRKGWVRKRREMIGKSHGLYMYYNPQGFSLWEYTP